MKRPVWFRRADEDVRDDDIAAALRGHAPEPAADLFDRIEASRAAGERVLLPTAPIDALPERRWRVAAAASFVVMIAAAAALTLGAPDASADASELGLRPARPVAGAEIEATYRASSLISDEEHLVLRARIRGADLTNPFDSGSIVRLATLRRVDDRTYRGTFHLPEWAAYAALVVETPDGSAVDTNGRQGWDVLVHGRDGIPMLPSLLAKAQDRQERDWQGAYATVREAVALYPDEPQPWSFLHTYQQFLFGPEGVDSLLDEHRAALARMHARALAQVERVGGDEAGNLFWNALTLGDTTVQRIWRDHLAANHPAHPATVQNRVIFELGRMRWSDPPRFLAEMETMWDAIGGVHPHQGDLGFGAALDTRDPERIRRWAERYLHFRRGERRWVAERLADHPALRQEALSRLRGELVRLREPRDDERPLFATAADYQRMRDAEGRAVLAAIGRTLLAVGDTEAALDTLALSVAAGWHPELFRTVAEARFAAADTAGAVELWAQYAVDPAAPVTFVDSIAARIAGSGLAQWPTLTSRARRRMQDEVLSSAVSRRLPNEIRILGETGTPENLASLIDGPALVVFWSRFCGYAVQAIPELERLERDLARDGAKMILLTAEPPSQQFRAAMADLGAADFAMYHDTRSEALRAFGARGTPNYFVVAGDGRIRFEFTDPAAAERQLAVLRNLQR